MVIVFFTTICGTCVSFLFNHLKQLQGGMLSYVGAVMLHVDDENCYSS